MRLVWLLLLFLICAACSQDNGAPAARHGRLAIDSLRANKVILLQGEWEFYWNRIIPPAAFLDSAPPKPDGYLDQPGSWTKFTVAGQPVPRYGFATMRLVVDPGPERRVLALEKPMIVRAYRLWIDSHLVSQRGVIGSDLEQEGGVHGTETIAFQSDGRPFQIVLQVSNHFWSMPGTAEAFALGPVQLIEKFHYAPVRRQLFLNGGLAMIAFYCMAAFTFRRADRSYLFFGVFILIWVVLFLLQYDQDLEPVAQLYQSCPRGLVRLQYVLLYLSMASGFTFYQLLYPRDFPAGMTKIVWGAAVAMSAAMVIMPYLTLLKIYGLFYLPCGGLTLYIVYKVVKAAIKAREGSVFVLVGIGSLVVCGLIDMATDADLINHMDLTMPVGLFAFALSQTLYISYRSARNVRKIEALSSEIDAKNVALKLKIAETELLSRQIVNVSEEERSRISQELHDGICQQLTAARLRFSVLKKKLFQSEAGTEELAELSQLLEASVNQAYDMSLGLWPVETGTGHLATSFEELCRRVARANKLEVSFRSNLPACARLSHDSTRQLYRIAQEALTNVVKHASACRVNVSVTCSAQIGTRLVVEDDGTGPSPRAGASARGGLGMRIMEHRALVMGGRLSLDNRPGGGTIVTCTVPCPCVGTSDCLLASEKHDG